MKNTITYNKGFQVAGLSALPFPTFQEAITAATLAGYVIVIDEEAYLAINGASRQQIGDAALHKNRGNTSEKTWQKIVARQAQKDRELIDQRDRLRLEYRQMCEVGIMRPPTRIERLEKAAAGHPDLASTQAAKRLLQKKALQ